MVICSYFLMKIIFNSERSGPAKTGLVAMALMLQSNSVVVPKNFFLGGHLAKLKRFSIIKIEFLWRICN